MVLNLREYLGTVHVLPLADHSGLLFRLAALCPALLEVSLHFDLEAAILFALPHEFIIVFRVELNRQRVVVAGQRPSLARLGFHRERAARFVVAVDFYFVPRLGSEIFSGPLSEASRMAWLDSPASGRLNASPEAPPSAG